MATLDDLEARVAALEASQADYRDVLAAVDALGVNQREHSQVLREHGARLDGLERKIAEHRMETRAQFRSTEEHFGELRDLMIGLRDR
ncbi:hypothetical protein M4D79_14930 [Mycolicibacterium novocastrense]|nr:hypothetical protein M4D79_14930 [Mycolicibacterium novocastrense]